MGQLLGGGGLAEPEDAMRTARPKRNRPGLTGNGFFVRYRKNETSGNGWGYYNRSWTTGQLRRWSSWRGRARHGNHQLGSCHERIRRDRLGRKDSCLNLDRKAIRNIYAIAGEGFERCANILCINNKGTTTLDRRGEHFLEKSMEKSYLTGSHGSVSSISFQSSASDYNQPVSRSSHREKFRGNRMDAGSCRCAMANRELRIAQNMYETRATARSKRKIAEMEAAVKQ